MSMRQQLPNRRPNITVEAEWQGHTFTATVGFDLDAKPREVFADMSKAGSAMSAVLSDACVIVSIALQHGISPEELRKSIGRLPGWDGKDAPASPVGALVDVLCGVT